MQGDPPSHTAATLPLSAAHAPEAGSVLRLRVALVDGRGAHDAGLTLEELAGRPITTALLFVPR